MQQGKTSNVELDAILQLYLPKERILPCDYSLHIDERSMRNLMEKAQRNKVVYLPIFTRSHWIAAIVGPQLANTGGGNPTFFANIYDSAPSYPVTRDIRQLFAPYPQFKVKFMLRAPRQRPHSEDCGLFMALAFFVAELDAKVQSPVTLPRAMRPLFSAILEMDECRRPSRASLYAVLRRLFNEPNDNKRQTIVKAYLSDATTHRAELHGGTRPSAKKSQPAQNEEDDKESDDGRVTTPVRDPFLDEFGNDIPVLPGERQSPVRYTPTRDTRRINTRGANNAHATIENPMMIASDEEESTHDVEVLSDTTTEEGVVAVTETVSERGGRALFIEHHVQQVLNRAARELTPIKARRITYILAAMALLSVGRGDEKQLRAQSLTNYRVKCKFPAKQEQDLHTVLDAQGVPYFGLHLNNALPENRQKRAERTDGNLRDGNVYMEPARADMLLNAESKARLAALYVRGLEGLPMPQFLYFNRNKYRFRLGARVEREEDGETWRYALTTDPTMADWGVYLPCRWHTYGALKDWESGVVEKGRTKRADDKKRTGKTRSAVGIGVSTARKNEEDSTDDDSTDDGEEELDDILFSMPEQILQDIARPCLNVPGRATQPTIGGSPSCPRNWYLFTTKPPHVSMAAWGAKTAETRRRHINWLQAIKSMPHDLLQYHSLASAILELVFRSYRHSSPTWSTVAAAMSLIAGALKDLPMYSRETKGIDLSNDVEWRAAQRTIKKCSQRQESRAPLPLSEAHYIKARALLRHKCPLADLFLALMWNCAARPGDITTLLVSDVRFNENPNVPPPYAPPITMNAEQAPARVYVLVWMARGKGSHFRSPYEVITTLSQEDASTLLKHMQSRGRSGSNSSSSGNKKTMKLFTAEDSRMVRTTVRTALQSLDARMALSSVRKGAIRYCARKGMTREALRMMTGHTNDTTLNRYLGVGHRTTEDEMREWGSGVAANNTTRP